MKCSAVLYGSTSTPHESGNKTKKKEKKLHTNGRAINGHYWHIRIQPVKNRNNVIVTQITVSNIRLRYLGIPISVSVFNILITVINND